MNEHERHMSMLRAAIPYIPPQSRHAMELILQADTLVALAASGPKAELEGCGLEAAEDNNHNENQGFTPDPEALLMHIREFCTPKETEIIQVILNFIHADHLFKSYKDFTKAHSDTLQAAEVSQTPNSPLDTLFQMINSIGGLTGSSGPNQMLEFLISQLKPEQKSAFEQLKAIMQNQEEV